MKVVAGALLLGAGLMLGIIIQRAVHMDCTPWMASVKLCAVAITK